jgi:hypothetical protein
MAVTASLPWGASARRLLQWTLPYRPLLFTGIELMKRLAVWAFAFFASITTAVVSHAASGAASYGVASWSTWGQFSIFGSGGSSGATKPSIGGNPGSYLRVFGAMSPNWNGLADTWIYARWFDGNAQVFSPGSLGAIKSIDYRFDTSTLVGPPAVMEVGLLLQQRGQHYAKPYLIPSGAAWTTKVDTGALAEDFSGENVFSQVFDSSRHPDFSSNGADIRFGVYTRTIGPIGSLGYDYALGIDNWTVTVHYIPEASTLAIAASALCALVTLQRRTTL